AIREKSLPTGHPDIARSLSNLAVVYQRQRRFAEAELLYKSALAFREKGLPAGHPDIAWTLGNLSNLQILMQRPAESLESVRRATAILIKRGTDATRDPSNHDEIKRNSWHFRQHVRAAWRVSEDTAGQTMSLRAESFRTAQWAVETEATSAL